jgi:Threonine dehydrogenase and related Zn-dependent dehydrogenases
VARVLYAGSAVKAIHEGDRIISFTSHRSHFQISVSEVPAVVPAPMRNEDAAFAYLYHLGYNAVLRAEIKLGSKVVIIGLGVLGLGSVAMAVMSGAQVFGVTNHSLPQERAKILGANACFDREHLSTLHDALGENLAHAVITTSNAWQDWRIALECAGYQGTIVVLGFPGRMETFVPFNPLDSAHFYARQLRIVAAGQSPEKPDKHGFLQFNQQDNLNRIIGWIGEGRLKPNLLISGEFLCEDITEAYEKLLRREGSPLTYLLRWKG